MLGFLFLGNGRPKQSVALRISGVSKVQFPKTKGIQASNRVRGPHNVGFPGNLEPDFGVWYPILTFPISDTVSAGFWAYFPAKSGLQLAEHPRQQRNPESKQPIYTKFYTEEVVLSMRFFENSMWLSGRLGFEVPDPKTKESKASDIYVKLEHKKRP